MKVVTYLGFTVLSIFIQFCVMDFIQEKINIKDVPKVNISARKKTVEDFLQNITGKPHALYYQTLLSKKPQPDGRRFSEMIFSNSTVAAMPSITTDITTTVFDILYDENSSVTQVTGTEFYTTTEFDNVTEITFFDTTNKSSVIPNNVAKYNFKKYCGCNLLFRVCDINCCCDPDCSTSELKQFDCEKHKNYGLSYDGCITHLLSENLRWGSSLDHLFCIVKTNLPDKRNIHKPNLESAELHNKWKDVHQHQKSFEFKKTLYKQDDPIWLLRNGTLYYFDIPTPMVNSYCTDRAPIRFLNQEKITCLVKFNDLEMFHITKTELSMVISATESTINSTTLDCSIVHCVNWTILACDNGICEKYNKSSHAPSCTENSCINVAFKIDYNFYYYDLKITNATIKLHIQKVLHNLLPFMSQEITVNFNMGNVSIDNVVKFSGNPGYIDHLPIIVSNEESNFTDHYFNSTPTTNYWILPENQNGLCIFSSLYENLIRFNVNKRSKCRYVHANSVSTQNSTSACKDIQDNISNLLGLNREIYIAPLGNPYGVKDQDWFKLQMNTNSPVYGQYSEQTAKLHCYNLVNRIAILFMYASVDEKNAVHQNKILSAKFEALPTNISFNIEDISTVLTTDINFVDATTPNLFVYASSPHLSIHLPKDFFFPFPSNLSPATGSSLLAVLCSIIVSLK